MFLFLSLAKRQEAIMRKDTLNRSGASLHIKAFINVLLIYLLYNVGMFDPQTHKYPYTEYTDEHYLKIKKNNGLVLTKDYPYIDNSFSFRFKQFFIRLVLVIIVFPVSYFKLGLRIKGRKNLRIRKHELKDGAVTISNHVHLWDFIAINKALRYRFPRILVWANNVRSENAFLIRMMGGVPIPERNMEAMMAFTKSIDDYLKSGGFLQIYPEGSMWEYYAPIRPFKKGAASIAIKNNKPVLPMAFSYRKPSKLRAFLFKQPACFTLTIGEPLYPNPNLDRHEQEIDLTIRMHQEVSRLAGDNKNLYEPIFNQSKRIDYYK